MNKSIMLMSLLALVVGCTTKNSYYVTGASKSDATVLITCQRCGMYQSCPLLDENTRRKLTNTVEEVCKNWEYSGAKAFGSVSTHQTSPGGPAVACFESSIPFQCVD